MNEMIIFPEISYFINIPVIYLQDSFETLEFYTISFRIVCKGASFVLQLIIKRVM